MTQIGEGIAVTQIRLDEDKCVFCGGNHENVKLDVIKPTGWKREDISGVGGRFSSQKMGIYPDGKSPPDSYRSEGHHCLAFSSFVIGAQEKPKNPRDRFAALNHYLKEKNYSPNNINNTIDLPGRKKNEDTDGHAQYKEYEKSVKEGKPLQLHIGGHVDKFMIASNLLLDNLVAAFKENSLCSNPDDEFKNKLLEKIGKAEDKAFKKTAGAVKPWVCHPEPLKMAEEYVMKTQGISSVTYPKL